MGSLGELLRELRGKKSLRVVSELTGLSHSYIADIEKGYRRGSKTPLNPSPDTLKKLSEAYNYPYEQLMNLAGYLEFDDLIDLTGKWDFVVPAGTKIEFDGILRSIDTPRSLYDIHTMYFQNVPGLSNLDDIKIHYNNPEHHVSFSIKNETDSSANQTVTIAGQDISITPEDLQILKEIRKHPVMFHELRKNPEKNVKDLIKMWKFIKQDMLNEDDEEYFDEDIIDD